MLAQRYLALQKPVCEWEMGTDMCRLPAVGIYVTDGRQAGTYVCQKHAEKAEIQLPGPVFYPKDEQLIERYTDLQRRVDKLTESVVHYVVGEE